MSTLPERRQDLADTPAAADRPVPGETWARGVRYARRRRLGTALIAVVAVLALVGIATLSLTRSHDPVQPAGTNAPLGIPDRLYEPSPWLPGTDDEGPLGPLAVLIPAERRSWGGSSAEWVGVSATTGEYRFLDLTHDAHEGIALSPDGKHVAYWTTGEISGSTNTSNGPEPTAGVAVYDTTTGAVRRASFSTVHGIAVQDLVWADNMTLMVGFGQWAVGEDDFDPALGQGVSNDYQWLLWPEGEDRPTPTDLIEGGATIDGASEGHVLAGRVIVDLADGSRTSIKADAPLMNVTAVDPSGARVAFPGDGGRNSRTPSSIQVNATDGSTTIVPGSGRTFRVFGWADTTHVVALQAPPGSNGDIQAAVAVVIDINDGSSRVLSDLNGVANIDFADDLFGNPTIAAEEPPRPLDQRLVAGGVVVVLAGSGLAFLLWRRRVRP